MNDHNFRSINVVVVLNINVLMKNLNGFYLRFEINGYLVVFNVNLFKYLMDSSVHL